MNIKTLRKILILALVWLVLAVDSAAVWAVENVEQQKASDGWFGKQFQTVINRIKGLFDWIWGKIETFFQGIVDWFLGLWTKLIDLLNGLWTWCCGAVESVTKNITDTVQWLWAGVCGFAEETSAKLWEWVQWLGAILVEWFYTLLDWLLGLCFDMFEWLMDQLPNISMPDGFEIGMKYFRAYAMLLDGILPVTEIISMFLLYVTLLTIIIVYRIVKSWMPGMAT